MERTLILNAGSSSVKFRVYTNGRIVLEGVIDEIGPGARLLVLGQEARRVPARTHREAGLFVRSLIRQRLDFVVHRVVHGGRYTRPVRITAAVRRELERLKPLAPLHMPLALELIMLFSTHSGAVQLACFDTMFHRTMPPVARTYALQPALAGRHGIERYGFHGMAHADLLAKGLALLGRKTARGTRIITCQLGNGVSLCAVRNGRSVDTTMGFTPLEGLVMGTRCGSIDPAIVAFLCEHERLSVREVLKLLENSSGLLGLAGSSDVRVLLARERQGDRAAGLALDVWSYGVKKAIGAYAAVLGGVDAVVLGGGVSQSAVMRGRILAGLEHLGIVVTTRSLRSPPRVSSGEVPVFVVTVDEAGRMYALTSGLRNGPAQI